MKKENVLNTLSAKIPSDVPTESVPLYRVNKISNEQIQLQDDYMDHEFNDSPFDIMGSAVFWMW